MKAVDVDSLLIKANIGDVLTVTLSRFYYKILERDRLDTGYQKRGESGWIHCLVVRGTYCGERCEQNGKLEIIKVRISDPFRMRNFHHNYVEFHPSYIKSIKLQKDKKKKR